ncbi:MAG TPA: GTPase-associated system all-helical protein GASH [Sphingorhabdus sp.]|uniref:GTPase-associated system all-helical protein GASH n=1 Tax=Sphingorhabdus sp. TaxID=1902408 RepID=UPI002B8FE506|nr:GTPase-associated system all-helical protein GASH [Sphingorhabdus sp.]HMT41618.1 GTPase-associated system all-helical protein GASH [Sphingorhabdus sp.]HMU20670.1 GTPase-associated system all-helical protein GASH [Sphingorhabdus sp.]
MNSDFARWYAELFMDEGATRAARWKGVVETAAIADHRTVEVLIRLAFASIAPPSGTKTEALEDKYKAVLAAMSGGSTSMDPSSAKRELQFLSAAALVHLFSSLPDAAIAVITSSFAGLRSPELPMDLAAMASTALTALRKKAHTRPDAKDLEIAVPKLNFEVSEETEEPADEDQWKQEIERLSDSVGAALERIVEAQNKVAKRLSRQLTFGDEELQMLWWLMGEYSSVAGKPFSKVDPMFRPLAFGKELGELAEISPGPASVAAMLARAGVGDKPTTIQDAINAPDIGWAQAVSSAKAVSPVTTPLHFALEKRAEVNSADAWQVSWAAMTGLPADTKLPAVRLAELFYLEHLFLYVGD